MSDITVAGLKVALYARVSTEEQREGQNIDSQLAELERFARDKAWVIAGTYKDEGWSGGVMERPDLDRLRDDAQKGVFDAVLINDVDRLARDVSHLGVIKRDLERKGVKVIFRKLPSDTSPTYNLMVNILGSFAEFERELISDRTRRGRRHRVEVRKQYLSSHTAYGYRYTPKDYAAGTEGFLEIVPEEAAVVRQMFEWVDCEALSARRVLMRLNELRIPPRNGAPEWGKSSVLRILHNQMYAGTWYYNKHQGCEPRNPIASPHYRKRIKSSVRVRPRSEWIPLELPEQLRLVTQDRWQRVQEQLARNLSFSPRNEKHPYLLKGLVQCGACGARYVGYPCHRRYYYRCIARCGKNPTIREQGLDEAVKSAIEKVMTDPDVILTPLRQLDKARGEDRNRVRSNQSRMTAEEKRLKGEEDRLFEAYRRSIISPAQLAQQLEKIAAARAAIDLNRKTVAAVDDMPEAEQVEKSVSEYCAEAAQRLQSFTADQWREFLRIIVETITFRGDRIVVRGRVPISPRSGSPRAPVALPKAGDYAAGRLQQKRPSDVPPRWRNVRGSVAEHVPLNCEGAVPLSVQTKRRGSPS